MPYLKQVTINNNEYYYLFHTVRVGDKFKKLSKYVGKNKPSDNELGRLKKEFLKEINKEPVEFEEEVPKVNVVEELQDLQDKEGYLSKESMIKISKEKDIPGVKLYGVATFYSQFRLKQKAKNTISVCRGTACHVKGSDSLLEYLEEILEIKSGQTTKDGKINLECVNCIGACAKAPAIMVNDEVYGELTKEKVKKIIEGLK
jgi:NADH-quinone oxidoreductase E subunit